MAGAAAAPAAAPESASGGAQTRPLLRKSTVRWADLRDSSGESVSALHDTAEPLPVAEDSYDAPGVFPEAHRAAIQKLDLASRIEVPRLAFASFYPLEAATVPEAVDATQELGSVGIAGVAVGAQESGQHAARRLNAAAPEFTPTLSEVCLASRSQPLSHCASAAGPPPLDQRQRQAARRRGCRGSGSTRLLGKRARASDAIGLEASGDWGGQRGDPEECPSLPPASEDDWLRRSRKRQEMVDNVKATPEYVAFVAVKRRRLAASGDSGGTDAGTPSPCTPDPLDRSVSKRQWERDLAQWRVGLRLQAGYAGEGCCVSGAD